MRLTALLALVLFGKNCIVEDITPGDQDDPRMTYQVALDTAIIWTEETDRIEGLNVGDTVSINGLIGVESVMAGKIAMFAIMCGDLTKK
jgi:hypothetical protein